MSFRDFVFPDVCDQLGLTLNVDNIHTSCPAASIEPALRAKIEDGLLLSQGNNNEKARSEFVVAPLLLEIWTRARRSFGLFSGTEMNVDRERGLNGVCDFLIARDPMMFQLRAPLLAIVEAKNDNVWNGFGQCVATMYAASLFNTKHGSPNEVVHGCSTTGRDWKFFRLTGTQVTIDRVDYALPLQLEELAGILLSLVGSPTESKPKESVRG